MDKIKKYIGFISYLGFISINLFVLFFIRIITNKTYSPFIWGRDCFSNNTIKLDITIIFETIGFITIKLLLIFVAFLSYKKNAKLSLVLKPIILSYLIDIIAIIIISFSFYGSKYFGSLYPLFRTGYVLGLDIPIIPFVYFFMIIGIFINGLKKGVFNYRDIFMTFFGCFIFIIFGKLILTIV